MSEISIPAGRVVRWVENFAVRHGQTSLRVDDGALHGSAVDGSSFTARLPFEATYHGEPDATDLARSAADPPADWGVLLVRKGGFAVARLAGEELSSHKVGRRHVQGRTKAGGQSQQRFARRRGNQARQAYEAAADHAARILEGLSGPTVTGGDRAAVGEVLADPRLRHLQVSGPWLDVADPKRAVLDRAILDAASVRFSVVNADTSR